MKAILKASKNCIFFDHELSYPLTVTVLPVWAGSMPERWTSLP